MTAIVEPELLLFPQWQRWWSSDPALGALTLETSAALARRRRPRLRVAAAQAPPQELVLAASRWANGEPPEEHADRPGLALTIAGPLLANRAALVWNRWLLLEAALLDASAAGDLLFAASALRTMLEELAWLSALDLDASALAATAGDTGNAAADRVAAFMKALWAMFGQFSDEQVLSGTGFPKAPANLLSERCLKAKRSLNGFVHPNYGSHVAALYPEGREAALVVLEGVAAAFEGLESLRMASEMPPMFNADEVVGNDRDDLLGSFTGEALPRAMAAVEAMCPVNPVDGEALSSALLRAPFVENLSQAELQPLLRGMPRLDAGGVQGFAMWAAAGPTEVVSFALAREAERKLTEGYSDGPPAPDAPAAWMQFQISSLELAVSVAGTKRDSLRIQLLRQLVRDNPLGVWICARALVENHGVTTWLPSIIEDAMDAMAASATNAAVLPAAAAKIDKALAEFLTTGASSERTARPWSLDQESGRARARIALPAVIQRAFPPGEFWSRQYDIGSAVLHGRTTRAPELPLDGGRPQVLAQACGLLILAKLEEEQTKVAAENVVQAMRLRHAATVPASALPDAGSRWQWGMEGGQLVSGRDFTGAGTEEDPFVLAPHVSFHVASQQLAADLLGAGVLEAIDAWAEEGRRLEVGADGSFYDHWRYDGRECWIRVPPQPDGSDA